MNDTITISKKELEIMIAEAIARNSMPRKKKDFRDVMLETKELEKVNSQYPIIAEKLSHRYASPVTDEPSSDELRLGPARIDRIYSRRRYRHGNDNYGYFKIYPSSVHESLRSLALATMGATIIKDLDDDEFEYSLGVYEKFKQFFLEQYDKRLALEENIERGKE